MSKEIDQLLAKANAGDPEAMLDLGLMYVEGDGVEVDKEKARYWWEKAAERGNPNAMFNLGRMYDKGIGVEIDKKQTCYWWKKAAKKDHPKAMFNLGMMYFNGEGVKKNRVLARKKWEQAAEKGESRAMFNLGRIYDKGIGVEVDKEEAFHWWEKAAKHGDAEAMSSLGVMYLGGEGVKKNRVLARKKWEQAAEKGNTEAMYILGFLYLLGVGCKSDNNKARQWWEKAAENGHTEAMYELGMMYAKGRGVEINRDQALNWLKKGAVYGHIRCGIFFRIVKSSDILPRKEIFTEIDRIIKAIEKWKRSRLYTERKSVTHFTSIEALRSLMNEKAIRLYNICYVNDPSEGSSLADYSRQCSEKGEDYCFHQFFKHEEETDPPLPIMYIASFSLENKKNKLPLWLIYGRGGKGVSLKIPSGVFNDTPRSMEIARALIIEDKELYEKLQIESGGNQNSENNCVDNHVRLALYEVAYENEEKEKILKELQVPLEEIIKITDRNNIDKAIKESTYEAVRMILSEIIYLFKNENYAYEKEVRLVTAYFPNSSEVHLDKKTGKLYVKTGKCLFNTGKHKITLGPKVNQEAARLEIEWSWHNNKCYGKTDITKSDIPYR